MAQFQQKVELIHSAVLAGDIVRLTFQAPDIAAASRPGQFVMIEVAAGQDPLLRRPFSIHQVGDDGSIQILFKVVGRGTALLAQARVGELISLLGPLGQGFTPGAADQACLVGGGMGIAPLLFLAGWMLGQRDVHKGLRVILGARNREELLPFLSEFQKLGLEVQAATDDGSLGHHGLVTDLVQQMALGEEDTVYTCGPRPMMAAIHYLCRQTRTSCQVSMETVMACGIGACLGCAVPLQAGGYAHVCTDGPVFEAGTLLWTL